MTLQKVNTKPNKGHNFISGGLVIIKRELRLKWNGNKGYDKAQERRKKTLGCEIRFIF